jgi:hypothetical protein
VNDPVPTIISDLTGVVGAACTPSGGEILGDDWQECCRNCFSQEVNVSRQAYHRSSPRTRQGSAVLLLACGLGLGGCGPTPPVAPEVQAQPWEGRPARVLQQKLGLVRPGQTVHRRFTITNDSQSKWTLARLHNGCACTASRPLVEAVWPGSSMEVDVDYTAAPRNVDDHRRIGIEFSEEAAPFVWLEIHACIREPISIFPSELRIVPANRGQLETSLEIHNCTDRDVHLLGVPVTPSWLAVREPVTIKVREYGHARQIWRVVIDANADGLTVGRHQARVELKTDCSEAPVKVIPVELDLREPVQVVPRQLSFGTLVPGTPGQRKLLLRYPTNGAPSSGGGVAITHNLGEQLQVIYLERSATLGEVSAVLTPTVHAADGEIKGNIVMTFEGKDLLPVEIPISAKVKGL